MWLPGHMAVSLLLCLPLLVMVKRERLLALYFVAFFSLLPDFLHLGELRIFTHSFVGLTVMLALSFGILAVLFRPRPVMYVIGTVAALGHLLGDLYIILAVRRYLVPSTPVQLAVRHIHRGGAVVDRSAAVDRALRPGPPAWLLETARSAGGHEPIPARSARRRHGATAGRILRSHPVPRRRRHAAVPVAALLRDTVPVHDVGPASDDIPDAGEEIGLGSFILWIEKVISNGRYKIIANR